MIILKYSSINNVMVICSSLSINVRVQHAWTGPEGSRMLRLPDFKTVDTFYSPENNTGTSLC
jgi:hypothetical protein